MHSQSNGSARGKENELTESQELTLDELIEEFEFLGEWEEQCRYLIELGEQLPELPDSEKTDLHRVLGCQARVWLVPESRSSDQHIWFHAKSDARLVDGLIVIVTLLFNGKSPEEILNTDFRVPFKRLGLESHLVPQRRNGLFAMVERVRQIAQALRSGEETPVEPAVATVDDADHGTLEHKHPPRAIMQHQNLAAPKSNGQPFPIDAVRSQFPILKQTNSAGRPVVYLDSASSSQKPQSVIDKEREVYEQYYANAYRGVYRFGDRVSRELESVREKAAELIGAASAQEIIFTSGSTMGLNLVANAWGRKFLRSGDEIVLSLAEHHANIVPWQWVAQHTGAIVRFAPLNSDGSLDIDAFHSLVSSRTRVVAMTGLSNVLGTITPLEVVSSRARDVGAILVVDGAQSVPHLPIDVLAEHVDFLAFSGHKLYGPSGIGVLYGRRDLLESMDPFLCGGHMISRVETDGFDTAPIPAKFEAGTLPIAQAIALGPAIDFVNTFDLHAVHQYEQSLMQYAVEQMQQLPRVRIFGPEADNRGAILPFIVEGASAQDIASLLDVHGVCVRHGHHCTMPLHDWLGVPATIRASFGIYNTRDDVDALVEGLKAALVVLKLEK